MNIMKLTICYGLTSVSLIGFTISMDKLWVPFILLFFLTSILSLLWFSKLVKQYERAEYRRHRSDSERYNEIEKRFEHIEEVLRQKADKPAKSNVRPGSRPSEQYQMMIGGGSLEHRREDQADQSV